MNRLPKINLFLEKRLRHLIEPAPFAEYQIIFRIQLNLKESKFKSKGIIKIVNSAQCSRAPRGTKKKDKETIKQ